MYCRLHQGEKQIKYTIASGKAVCDELGNVGQGLNMTMEDAAELAWFVQQYGLTPEALRSFEKERIPRVSVIVRKAQVSHFS